MCGIIARISNDKNPIKTLEGLKCLEYRGYDSYGILLSNKDEEFLYKDIGEISDKQLNKLKNFDSNIEIGHTRWATHGGVTKTNAHPHFDTDKKFYVVMNGIVENYDKIRDYLKGKVKIISQSDTEVIPQLYSLYIKETNNPSRDLLEATQKVIKKLQGEFSYVVKYKNIILAYKNINPIIVGKTSDKEVIMTSDNRYVQNNSIQHFVMNDEEVFIARLEKNKINFLLLRNFKEIKPDWKKSIKSETLVHKNHKLFMEKEVYEQRNIKDVITDENLSSVAYLHKAIKNKKPIVLTAAGTSYHAAYCMHYLLLRYGINTQVVLASELGNYAKVLKDCIIVCYTQSGETADLIHPLKLLQEKNEIITITNSPSSTLDRMAQKSIYLNCGPEIAVASTKAFTYQIFVSYLLEQKLTGKKITDKIKKYEQDFDIVLTKNKSTIKRICKKFKNTKNFFFIGRNQNHPLALEGALKLKEVSYIHAEGFAGGELKHGTLALIEKGVPVVVIGDSQEIISNAIEVSTRGGVIIGLSENKKEVFDYYLQIPKYYKEIFHAIALQQIALEMAMTLGKNPDKPRNLAKSVTVR